MPDPIKATDYTAEQIMTAISAAMTAHDMPAVASLVGMLAIVSPHDAQLIVEAMHVGRALQAGTDA